MSLSAAPVGSASSSIPCWPHWKWTTSMGMCKGRFRAQVLLPREVFKFKLSLCKLTLAGKGPNSRWGLNSPTEPPVSCRSMLRGCLSWSWGAPGAPGADEVGHQHWLNQDCRFCLSTLDGDVMAWQSRLQPCRYPRCVSSWPRCRCFGAGCHQAHEQHVEGDHRHNSAN